MMNNIIWYISKEASGRQKKNAAGKAPSDINTICKERKYKKLPFPVFPAHWKHPKLQKAWIMTVGLIPWYKALFRVKKNDIVLLQYPFYGNRLMERMICLMKQKKNIHFIMLLHDLESLRNRKEQEMDQGRYARGVYAEHHLMPQMDVVICHNDRMREYLITQGIEEDRLVSLEIFDYLTECNPVQKERSAVPSIAIAGNLTPEKCGYIYGIKESKEKLAVHLYGVGCREDQLSPCISYHGAFPAEELPKHLAGDMGLVWDGPTPDYCGGNMGEYLRYNNPHKTSLYLASNKPVVVWSQSAMADFVMKYDVGIAVDSIADIPDRMKAISAEEFEKIRKNVREQGYKLRSGYYTKKAIDQALEIINDKETKHAEKE